MFKLPNDYPGKPFGRSLTMRLALNRAEALQEPMRSAELAKVHPYFSRGKGRSGMRPTAGIPSGNKCNGCYDPPGHNGQREMQRRFWQMADGTHGL